MYIYFNLVELCCIPLVATLTHVSGQAISTKHTCCDQRELNSIEESGKDCRLLNTVSYR